MSKGRYRDENVLITVKTYPTPATKSIEQSCTAGITEDGKWIRLFPIPFRLLTPDRQFKRYDIVRASVTKASDPRPESHHVDWDSIEVVGHLDTKEKWRDRKQRILPLEAHCLCCLKRDRDATGEPTLGMFKPGDITAFRIEPENKPRWTEEEKHKLSQPQFFLSPPKTMLEKIPYKFYYDFRCNDEAECRGHKLHCTDWEMGQAFRAWSKKYKADWERPFRERFEVEMLTSKDLYFYVGTMAGHPAEWLIVGLFYPPRS